MYACFEYTGTDNPVFIFQTNLDFILKESMLLIMHDIKKWSSTGGFSFLYSQLPILLEIMLA